MESDRRATGGVAPRANGTAAVQRGPLARWRGVGAAWVAAQTQNAPGATLARFGIRRQSTSGRKAP